MRIFSGVSLTNVEPVYWIKWIAGFRGIEQKRDSAASIHSNHRLKEEKKSPRFNPSISSNFMQKSHLYNLRMIVP